MEFNKKLQELRKQKGLTQEELANALYVSRTAVSKWEAGRGYPSIQTLKNIAMFFGVTLDELLSGSEILNIAEKDSKQKQSRFVNLIFGLLDINTVMLYFLPFFAQRKDVIKSVGLLQLTDISNYLKVAYLAVIIIIMLCGVLTLALQWVENGFWIRYKNIISVILTSIAILIFVLSLQPYAAILLFVFLLIKVLILLKTN